MGVRSFIVVGR